MPILMQTSSNEENRRKGGNLPPTFPNSTCDANLRDWLLLTKATANWDSFVGLQVELLVF